jgi:uncharacterized membrane protein
MARRSASSSTLLAGFLAGAAVTHAAVPKPYDAMIPKSLPGSPRSWTYASGVAELGLAAAVAIPRTRRRGALAAALFFAAVFPANVKMALDWRSRPAPLKAAAFGRLPFQLPLIWWAVKVSRRAER